MPANRSGDHAAGRTRNATSHGSGPASLSAHYGSRSVVGRMRAGGTGARDCHRGDARRPLRAAAEASRPTSVGCP